MSGSPKLVRYGADYPNPGDEAKNKSKSAPNTPYPLTYNLQPTTYNLQKKTPNRGLVHQNFVKQTVAKTN